ncbi:TPA: hypothetical protein N2826_004679 [Vibrio parahaemolyticus]|nr:hypothetical protein [Vibrio parahaemolyticus]
MISNIISYVLVTVFAIWLWNDAPAQHRDNLFYVAVVCSQIGFFIYSRKLEKLKNKVKDLENKHSLETKNQQGI